MSNKPSRIVEFSTLPAKCAYIDHHTMRMEYKFIEDCPYLLNQKLVQQGWRRFGEYYSRPNCDGCDKCLSLRIKADEYRFTKNAKRTIRKNANTKFLLQKPTLTRNHLNLYEKYHRYMEEKKVGSTMNSVQIAIMNFMLVELWTLGKKFYTSEMIN